MKCDSCNKEISNTMKHSIASNACPFCGSKIMEDAKAQQYLNLITVLDQTIFTNKIDIDTQIKDKVVQLMLDNFVFMKLENPESRSDVITISDEDLKVEQKPAPVAKVTQVVKPTKAEKKQTQKIEKEEESEDEEDSFPDEMVRSVPSGKRSLAPSPSKKSKISMQDYASIQDEMYRDSDDSYDESEPEESIQEILKIFPNLSEEEAKAALKSQSEMKKVKMPQRGLTGKGIKRL